VNVGEIKTRVKRQFGDESSVQVTDDDIVRWINDGQREIATVNDEVLETIATTAITSGTADYALPEDMLRLRTVRYGNRKIQGLTLQEAEEKIVNYEDPASYKTGTPEYFWIYANRITLYPTPNLTDSDNLKLYYTRIPAAVAIDADIPELHAKYHSAIIAYVLQQAYEMDEDWTASGNKSAQFVNNLNSLKESDWITHDSYPTIRVLPEDDGF
jgi:hypothetical protein